MSEAAVRGGIQEFRAAVGGFLAPGAIRAAVTPDAVDNSAPEMLVAPDGAEAVARILVEAQRAKLGVIPVGGGTHLSIGNVPVRYDVALSLGRLDAVVAHEPGDMTVTVQPGVRLADLQRRLAADNQELPLDPAGSDAMTVGGVIAANMHGPLRHAFGTARDWVIGMTVALPDGTLVKSGGRVVKNVTGYDMHKLHIGALGTLGVIVEVTCKLAPIPQLRVSVAATFNSAQDACRFTLDAWDAGLALEAAEVLSPPAANAVVGRERWTVIVRAAGVRAAVDRTLTDMRREAGRLGGDCEAGSGFDPWPRWRASFALGGTAIRAFAAPSKVADTMEALDRPFAETRPLVSTTVSAGVVRAVLKQTAHDDTSAPLDQAIAALGRNEPVVIDAAPRAAKERVDVFGPLRADFPVMRRLKQQFDPNGVLAPGRFMGRL